MNIVLPIILNCIVVLIGVLGIFVGKKNGALYEFIKLILICGASVGLYFLAPIIYPLLLKINIIEEALLHGVITEAILYSILNIVLFIITYILISIIFSLIYHKIGNNENNGAKKVKIKGINKKETRELRKQQRKLDKINKHNREAVETKKPASKVLGIIFGFILSLVVSFVLFLPVKPIMYKVTDDTAILDSYEYTAFGQLDKITNIVDIVNHVGE